MARDYYGILGVAKGASDQEIKRAYRKKARELHPDVNPGEEDRFKEVSTAYEVLTDPEKRRIVDAGGDPMAGPGQGGFSGGGFGSGGLGDVFEAFFGSGGGGGFGGGFGSGRGPRSRVQPGEPALVAVELDLDECAAGVNKEITVDTAILCDLCKGSGTHGDSKPTSCDTCKGQGEIQAVQRSFLGQVMTVRECPTCHGVGEVIPDPCRKCGGDGRVRSRRTMTVKIPAGIENGMRVRLSGQGEVGPGGGPAGDLYVEVTERQHEVFVRDKDDLHCTVRVPIADAALGNEIDVDTILDGTARVTIAPGTQPGHVVKVKGQGMPHLNTGVRGTLHAHLEVVVPTKLDTAQTEALNQFREASHEQPEVVSSATGAAAGGLFSRLRNAFAGR
ncbi:molecular chaperone DnaJ [Gordonia sp. Z-3]|uniref:Chaperone protein DnaJ n=1 Tax=Gordonia tangerina TaxID=2911060 RepID=A0ABS9DFF8_9ACTN|nr:MULTISPECIES: molecular chaperone DnaJ [Gordonia]MAQ82332.1 molecular chaperone DnaJ [Maritimibacter sp.]MAU84255.1 molecular chaperone DnaJ [Gordonia sp. (in: high G+C Gram-positive bacteria)]MCF3937960.1 molecular chaperone DnaJ [Gordonia tangerina]MED5800932.1 molecular chaperone DnaJ [Gordonia sp. Z-3]